MNKKAIVVYVDNIEVNIIEFSWLYKTFIMYELYNEYDIVCYCNPNAITKIPQHENIIIKSLEPLNISGSFWEAYGFVNSFAMFNEPEEETWIRERYEYILKTDCDVFLTKNILGYEPDKLMVGMGGYMSQSPDTVLPNLIRIKDKLGLNYHHLNHIGASIFGPTEHVTTTVNNHYQLTNYILMTEFSKEFKGQWPNWFRGVASMYAIHLAINHMFSEEHLSLYTLDTLCWANKIKKDTIHIHAWHGDIYFSKHKFFLGEYNRLISDIVPTIAGEYCHWIASNDLQDLIEVVNKLK